MMNKNGNENMAIDSDNNHSRRSRMNHWKAVLMGLTCATALAGLPADGQAQTVPAMAGHGWPNHFDGCFGSSWARMVNNCSDTVGAQRLLIVPAQAYGYGWYNNTYARAAGNGSDGMTNC